MKWILPVLAAGALPFALGCGDDHHGDDHDPGEHHAPEDGKSGMKEDAKATDPVCGMQVTMASAKKQSHDGKDFYFCSSACETKFQDNPMPFMMGYCGCGTAEGMDKCGCTHCSALAKMEAPTVACECDEKDAKEGHKH